MKTEIVSLLNGRFCHLVKSAEGQSVSGLHRIIQNGIVRVVGVMIEVVSYR